MDELTIAAYLDRRLPTDARERVEAHLASCSDCRQDFVQAHGVLGSLRRRRQLRVAASVLASAVLVAIVVRSAERGHGTGTDLSQLRGTADVPALMAYGPDGDTPLALLRFVWATAPTTLSYRLTVTRGDGTPVWRGSSTDTTKTLPDSVALQPGNRYFWFVDALLANGATQSTEPREFRPIL
jgi:hypothetical protein